MKAPWNQTTDFDSVCRRAGGRRRYNAAPKAKAEERREKVLETLERCGYKVGRTAAALGVSRWTIRRDLAALWPQTEFYREQVEEVESLRRAIPRIRNCFGVAAAEPYVARLAALTGKDRPVPSPQPPRARSGPCQADPQTRGRSFPSLPI